MNAMNALWRFSRPHTIIGSIISICTLYAIVVSRADVGKPLLLVGALVIGVSCNLFIVGLNQLADVRIDRINKPWLPLPSGALSRVQAWAIVISALCICLGLAFWVSPMLFALVALANLIGWAYSMPPLYLKRHHLSSALAITVVRGLLVNLGGFLVYDHLVNGVVHIPLNVWILTAFIITFSISIAWFKDLPDVVGDARFHIRTLPLLYSPRAVLIAGHMLVGTAYLFSIVMLCLRVSTDAADALRTRILVNGHVGLLILFAVNALALRLDRGDLPVRRFYSRFWWFFFAEYGLYLLAYLFTEGGAA
jgi:homogentisate phytyltransferase/homogentisate geranylgeranyltransferase